MSTNDSRHARAVFLDRDGVLVEDHGPLTRARDIVLAAGAAEGLRALAAGGWKLVVVSNQTTIARGLLDEGGVRALQAEIEARLGVALDGFYFCPHHPSATVAQYRGSCTCRKPAPGLLLDASAELGLDLYASVMVGDRPSDVEAGRRAGCRTVMIESGRHADPPIEIAGGFHAAPADHACASLAEAARHILAGAWA